MLPNLEIIKGADWNIPLGLEGGAGSGEVSDVITPAETRAYLIRAFRMLATKEAVRPRKRHGNIPL